LNLDEFQRRQAEVKRKSADEAIELRISETYLWLIVPGQPDPKGEDSWSDLKLQGQGNLAARASKKLRGEECLLVQMGAVRLRAELDRVPLWTGNHVSIKQLCEYMARYLYLPRLRDERVLITAIEEGVSSLVWAETFAYAEGWDEQRQRYQGLRAGTTIRAIVDERTLLVKPEAAKAQIEKDRQSAAAARAGTTAGEAATIGDGPETATIGEGTLAEKGPTDENRVIAQPPKLSRFHASVRIDPLRLGRDAARIAEEVVQHLSGLVGAEVEVTLEIQAHLPDGASEKLVRDVTENCRTLKFNDYGFEEN
jgi:hypothetical protein